MMSTTTTRIADDNIQLDSPTFLPGDGYEGPGLASVVGVLRHHMLTMLATPILAGALAYGITYFIPPTFTARTTFLPPQQQQGIAASALSQLGALGALAGGAAGIKTPADQYVSLIQSVTVSDRLIEKFDLHTVYDVKYRFEARRELREKVHVSVGKKDGMISLEVDDPNPQRAAQMANEYVIQLRRITSDLALTEAQQRRVFFEEQLKQTRDRLAQAQRALQASGFNPGALKAEPKAAAETYARLNAEVAAAEVRLQTVRRTLSDTTPEVQQQQSLVAALRAQLARVEASSRSETGDNADYVGRYRDYKYQEALFDSFSRQYELARLDESREGALIQVVDTATPPERRSRPRRGFIALAAAIAAAAVLSVWLVQRHAKRTTRPS